jgi:hypothetical protein
MSDVRYKIERFILSRIDVSIKSHLNMSKEKQNCLFCDSSRHTTFRCTSPIKGKYTELISLYSVESPNFNSYTLKELKLIAYSNPYERSFEGSPGMRDNRLNRKYGRKPIPLTLSKNRLVKALEERWEMRRPILEKFNKKPTEEVEDCPICLESIQTYEWSFRKSEWLPDYCKNTIKTVCNHHFCGDCWSQVKPIRDYYSDHSTKPCPLCRRANAESDTLYHT